MTEQKPIRHYRDKQLIKAPDGWVPTSEAATMLNVEPGTVRRLVTLGTLEPNYIGTRMYIRVASIEKYKTVRGGPKGGRKPKPKEDVK